MKKSAQSATLNFPSMISFFFLAYFAALACGDDATNPEQNAYPISTIAPTDGYGFPAPPYGSANISTIAPTTGYGVPAPGTGTPSIFTTAKPSSFGSSDNVCKKCKLTDNDPIDNFKASMKQMTDDFVKDYGAALLDITCDPQDEPQCSQAIQNAQSTVDDYKIFASESLEKLDQMACLSSSAGPPDMSCNITSEGGSRQRRSLVDILFPIPRRLQVDPETSDVVLVSDRSQVETVKHNIDILAIQGAIDIAGTLLDALPECGGLFTGDGCAVTVSIAKMVAAAALAIMQGTIAGLQDAQYKRDDKNGGIQFEIIDATFSNVLVLNEKANKMDQKLDELNEKADQALEKLDELLCPFKNTEPFTVLGQGCDGVDQDCNKVVDECEEDKVPPTILLSHAPQKYPFQSVSLAETFLRDNVQLSDDCAATINSVIELASERDCTTCNFTVSATDTRCVGKSTAAVATKSFSFLVDSIPPIISCGFFFPQDPFHVLGDFDPCEGLAPPFPAIDDFLHIDRNCFNRDIIDVQFWYQIETQDFDGILPVQVRVMSNEFSRGTSEFSTISMSIVVERRDLPNDVHREKVYLAPESCHESGRDDGYICEVDGKKNVTTRFYDIEVSAQDAAGNKGKKTCSVIVVPPNHYDLEIDNEGKGGKQGKSEKSDKQGKSKKNAKKGGKKGDEEDDETRHDPNDLRDEFRISTQRFVLIEQNHDWDPQLNTRLRVPDHLMPPRQLSDFFDITMNQGGGKKGGKKSEPNIEDAEAMLLCNQPITCPDEPTVSSGKKGGKASKKYRKV